MTTGLALLTGATGPASAAGTTGTGQPPKVVERTVSDRRITESSGLVVSTRLPGVLWTFNDSGGTPDLYGVGRSGEVVARLTVQGAAAVDWEAATAVRGVGGGPAIAVADIGDNAAARPVVRVYVVAEPAARGRSRQRPQRTLVLTYPEGPTDAEAVFTDPATGRLYVVTKGLFGGRLYAVPTSAWPGTNRTARTVETTLEPVAEVPLGMVTDGVALPDGRVALRTYGELAIMPPVTTLSGGTWTPLATATLPRQGQGEGLAVDAAGRFLLSTEGAGKSILRFTAPADVVAAGRPVASPSKAAAPSRTPAPSRRPAGSAGSAGSATPAQGAAAGPSDAGTTVSRGLVLGLLGAAATALATLAALTVRARRPRTPRPRRSY